MIVLRRSKSLQGEARTHRLDEKHKIQLKEYDCITNGNVTKLNIIIY